MNAEKVSPARSLGSVALRYRQPLLVDRWPPPQRGPTHWPVPAEPEQDRPDPGSSWARSPELACLETVLLLAREPLGSRKLAQLASLADGTKARTLVRELNRRYDEEDCAFRVMEVAGGFQLMTRPKFAPWLRRLHTAEVEVRLSGPAIETLAVVAYRQPVLRADIEAIRGVQCGEILRQLMERDLVRMVGRSEDLGRPFLYGTTRRFLQIFGLRHLDELPRPEITRSSPLAGRPGGLDQNTTDYELLDQPICLNTTGGEANVKTAATVEFVAQDTLEQEAISVMDDERAEVLDYVPKREEDEDLEDEDFDDDEDDEDDDEEDDDFEDEEWEEVDDEDEDPEDLDEEEEEDEDWDDEDEEEEWEDEEEEDEDWDDDEEEEEEEESEGEGDWE